MIIVIFLSPSNESEACDPKWRCLAMKYCWKNQEQKRPAVNLINVKRANFLNEHWFWQIFSSYTYAAEMTFVRKICASNIDEIDTWMFLNQLKSCGFAKLFTYFSDNNYGVLKHTFFWFMALLTFTININKSNCF